MTHFSAISAEPADLWFGSSRVRIRVASAEGADGICVIEHLMPEGDAPPLHIHRNEDEIFHVLEGRMRFRVGGRGFDLGPGETALAPKGVAHHYRVTSPEGARCLTITRGGDFEAMVRAVSRPAEGAGLPPQAAPDVEALTALALACATHGIDLVGPPLA